MKTVLLINDKNHQMEKVLKFLEQLEVASALIKRLKANGITLLIDQVQLYRVFKYNLHRQFLTLLLIKVIKKIYPSKTKTRS